MTNTTYSKRKSFWKRWWEKHFSKALHRRYGVGSILLNLHLFTLNTDFLSLGGSFHLLNADSRRLLWAPGSTNWSESTDLKIPRAVYSIRMHSGPKALGDLLSAHIILKCLLQLTGSQSQAFRTGVICSDLFVAVRSRAAAFWMSCGCLMLIWGDAARWPWE